MTTVKETFTFPRSSNVESATYDPQDETLEIVFIGGRSYSYSGVPVQEYERLCRSPSAGKAARRIGNIYLYEAG